ncbi:MAG: reverse transcriptase domain-containing protein [Dehalococcoidia bacterium]|jgi:RNA-directed DNA polymerase
MQPHLKVNPTEIPERFHNLRTAKDIADLLEIDLQRLNYRLYKASASAKYTTFQIPKKSGDSRTISSPTQQLKTIQQKLNYILLHIYHPKPSVHSYLKHKSVVSNAAFHCKKRNILTIDLQDFFPSITFPRIRGMLMGIPYQLDPKAATILAQICSFNNELPQGAPTSPIISNMICGQLDSELTQLAKEYRCHYSRYADDLTFSTNLREFPSAFLIQKGSGQIEIGEELREIIESNGFDINDDKIHLQRETERQQVTGLIVNEFPNVRRKYVRNLRATLHAWRKYGYEAAQKQLNAKYNKKYRNPTIKELSLKNYIRGKFNYLKMVRGVDSKVYFNLLNKLNTLDSGLIRKGELIKLNSSTKPIVLTEGKTDIKHMTAALNKLKMLGNKYSNIDIDYQMLSGSKGKDKLKNFCENHSQLPNVRLPNSPSIICLFDREDDTIKEMTDENKPYKCWGNNVFSLVIPNPSHRLNSPNICIELYYKDPDIMIMDKDKLRLYFNSEFDSRSYRHKIHSNLNCIDRAIIDVYYRKGILKIIDRDVFDENSKNIALSKEAFASYVLSREPGFENVDFNEFIKIFDIILQILELSPT